MKRSSIAIALLAAGLINVADAASLSLVGGSLSAGYPGNSPNVTNLSAGATGDFSATKALTDQVYLPDGSGRTEQVSTATATLEVTPDSLTVSAISDGSSYIQYPSGLNQTSILPAQGTVTFALSAPTTFNYSASNDADSSETILDSHGAALLSVGCRDLFSCPGGQTFQGSLMLAPGVYTFSFSDTAVQMAGSTLDANMSFSLQPVPLPAAAWLLVSGLVPLFRVGMRRGRRGLV